MRTIAVANRKGGVGKSTISVHIAAGLATRGYNVLLIDTDPQGHAGYSLGVDPEPGLFTLMVDRKKFQEVVKPIPPSRFAVPDNPANGRLFILPSDERTTVVPLLEKSPFAFHARLQEVQDIFDYVILDTAPTATMFDGSVYMAAGAFLYVTELEALSFDGLNQGIEQIREFSQPRAAQNLPANYLLGILPNRYRRGTENHENNLKMLQQTFGETVWNPIPLRTLISESANFRRALYSYAPTSREANMMWNLTLTFEKAVAKWQGEA
jgi:chromosome partitioning protein